MVKIKHLTIKDSSIFIEWFDTKKFLFQKKEKKDYGFSDVNIIFAYNGYGKSSFTALLKTKAKKSDVLWNDYKPDLKEKWKLWSLSIRGFVDNNQKEKVVSYLFIHKKDFPCFLIPLIWKYHIRIKPEKHFFSQAITAL